MKRLYYVRNKNNEKLYYAFAESKEEAEEILHHQDHY